jgi:hypothetical protein
MTLHANRPLLLAMQIFHTAQRQQWCEISIEWLLIHLLLGARTLVFLVANCRNLVCVFPGIAVVTVLGHLIAPWEFGEKRAPGAGAPPLPPPCPPLRHLLPSGCGARQEDGTARD